MVANLYKLIDLDGCLLFGRWHTQENRHWIRGSNECQNVRSTAIQASQEENSYKVHYNSKLSYRYIFASQQSMPVQSLLESRINHNDQNA